MRPRVDRSTKPSDNKGNNYNLRTIYMPSDLSERFLDRAKTNTNKNIETCGILAGRLSQNVFVLSHCIIPKQSGTSDTCNTEDEHEIFEVVDQLNLITLGWIHVSSRLFSACLAIYLKVIYFYRHIRRKLPSYPVSICILNSVIKLWYPKRLPLFAHHATTSKQFKSIKIIHILFYGV